MVWRPFPVTLFDCDSTLSTVEGIDELADGEEQQRQIAQLTDAAMEGSMPLEDVYGERLSVLQPTRAQMRAIRNRYKSTVVPQAREVIAALNDHGNESWVISGGLYEPVAEFATWLGVPSERVQAVPTEFDPLNGEWWSPTEAVERYASYSSSGLTTTTGKADIIQKHVDNNGRKMFVGDGMSDLATADSVDLFVAFAGVVSRSGVVDNASVVVTCPSIAPVLALATGPGTVKEMVGGRHDEVARRCLAEIDDGGITFNDEQLAETFTSSFDSSFRSPAEHRRHLHDDHPTP